MPKDYRRSAAAWYARGGMETHPPASGFRCTRGFDGRARPRLIIAALGVLALAPVATSAAELQTFELPSELVGTSTPGGTLEDGRTVPKAHVLLPDGYHASSKRGYPVLWLLHGAKGGTDTWIPAITTLAAGFPGSGTVEIRGRRGCRFSAELPFELPPACRRS